MDKATDSTVGQSTMWTEMSMGTATTLRLYKAPYAPSCDAQLLMASINKPPLGVFSVVSDHCTVDKI